MSKTVDLLGDFASEMRGFDPLLPPCPSTSYSASDRLDQPGPPADSMSTYSSDRAVDGHPLLHGRGHVGIGMVGYSPMPASLQPGQYDTSGAREQDARTGTRSGVPLSQRGELRTDADTLEFWDRMERKQNSNTDEACFTERERRAADALLRLRHPEEPMALERRNI